MTDWRAERWELFDGPEQLGVLSDGAVDWPWLYCRFEPSPAFAVRAQRFVHEAHCADDDCEDLHLYGMALSLVRASTRGILVNPLLHVDGELAWFRGFDHA